VLARHSGRPFLYFVCLERKKGPVNAKAIADLEDFLIDIGLKANEALMNKRGRKRLLFSIRGVLPARPGEATATAARKFRRMMQL
jgi:hypothetical protein